MRHVRGCARLLALALACAFCVAAHLLTRALRMQSHWPQRCLGWTARICGAVVELRGRPLAHDVLFVSNHTSWLDIPIIAGATGTAFVANSGVRDWPLIGWLAGLNNTVYVDRTDRKGVQAQIDIIRQALARHQPIAIFPEGTTSNGLDLLPFKPSLLEVLASTPRAIRVQPLRIDYGAARDLAWIDDEPAPRNAWRVLTRPGRFVVRLECLDPFSPAEIGDRKAVAAEARRRILAASARSPSGV
ncbi:lysophospholipid acyltransferase family protein [Sphingomonas changbaiensis]|nr:lysophospholipid acyltransferase family protein [Sphingomonas changbaiensis]